MYIRQSERKVWDRCKEEGRRRDFRFSWLGSVHLCPVHTVGRSPLKGRFSQLHEEQGKLVPVWHIAQNTEYTQNGNGVTFWRTFHHDEKISPAWWGWGVSRPHPFTIFTITCKFVLYAPAERAERLSFFYSNPICTLWAKAGACLFIVYR